MGGCKTVGLLAALVASLTPGLSRGQNASVRVDYRADRDRVSAGDPVGFTIVVTNGSDTPLTRAFVIDAPASGLRFTGRARATVAGQAVDANARRENPTSRRLVRFGPFDVPAGAALVLTVQAVVGADVRPGRVRNRARLVDGAGVALAQPAETTLHVVDDPVFDEGQITGRVFCDDDRDHRADPRERGFGGARVYLDTGSYAVTDSDGRYHLSQIDPGTHALRLDADTLAGGRVRGNATHVLHMTRGLASKVDFAIDCNLEQVTSRSHFATTHQREATAPPPPPPPPTTRIVSVRADFATGTFIANGSALPFGWAQVDAHPDAGAVRLSAPADLPVDRWRARINAADGTVVHDQQGTGRPPPRIAVDPAGLTANTTYTVSFDVSGADGSRGTSAPRTWVHEPAPAVTPLPALSIQGTMFRGKRSLSTRLKNALSKFAVAANRQRNERFSVQIRAPLPATATHTERRLALAARRAKTIKYVRRLGVADDRYDIEVLAADAGRLDIGIVQPVAPSPTAPPVVAATLSINGQAMTVEGDQQRFDVAVPATEALVLDITTPLNQRVRLVRAAPPTEPPPPPAPTPIATVHASNLRVHLPPAGTVLGHDELMVVGTTHPANRITVNGVAVHVDRRGHFAALTTLAPGKSRLAITARDRAGNRVELAWPIEVAQASMFSLVVAEAAAASAYESQRGWSTVDAALDGMTDETTVQLGPVLLHGRVAAYVKARYRDFDITAHVDTARAEDREGFFDQLIDPNRDATAVFGDSAREVRDAQARGPVYLHIADGKGTSGTVGSIRGGIRGGDLLRYERTVYGAQLHIDNADLIDGHDIDLHAFTAFDDTTLSRDVNLLRATGGSLYYLRHGSVVEGSERVRILVRDRDSGLIVAERIAERDADYAIDYRTGRLLFSAPPASVASGGWLMDNYDATATPLDGDPVFVEVQYEHADPAGTGGAPTGVYVRDTVGKLAIGAGTVSEGRVGDDYLLWGADARYDLGGTSNVTVEVAGSRNADATHGRSDDGGLSFVPFGGATASHNIGVKATARLRFGKATRTRWYAQSLDPGFSSMETTLEQGRTAFGGLISHDLNARDRIAIRHDGDLSDLTDRTSLRTAAQWRRVHGKWTYGAETGHHRIRDSDVAADRLGTGVLAAYRITSRVTVRGSQQVVHNAGDRDPTLDARDGLPGVTTSIGGDFELAPELVLSLDESVRWNGDNATRFGLRTRVGDTSTMYIREQVGSRDGRFVSTTIVGADDRFGADRGTRSYGEYQIEQGALGQRNRAVLGLGHRWPVAPGVRIGLGYEHQQVFGGFTREGVAIGHNQRDLVHAGVEYTAPRQLKAAARAELRFDDGQSELDAPTAAPGVLPPGQRVQVVAGLGANYQPVRDLTLIGRARYSRTEDRSNHFVVAEYAELLAGGALRPRRLRWLDVFGQYAYQLDQRPTATPGADAGDRLGAHVFSIAPAVNLPLRLRLSAKLAWKRTRLRTPNLGAPELSTRTTALLYLLRLSYRWVGHWETAAELRQLTVWRPSDDEEARHGALFEVTYTLRRRIRLGLGYNLSRFSDNELRDLERDSHGLFFRVVGTY